MNKVYVVEYPYNWFYACNHRYDVFTSFDLVKAFISNKLVKDYKRQSGRKKLEVIWTEEYKNVYDGMGKFIVSDRYGNEVEILVYERELDPLPENKKPSPLRPDKIKLTKNQVQKYIDMFLSPETKEDLTRRYIDGDKSIYVEKYSEPDYEGYTGCLSDEDGTFDKVNYTVFMAHMKE